MNLRAFRFGTRAMGLLAVLVSAWAVSAQGKAIEEQVQFTYTQDSGGQVTVLGVCSVVPGKIECWSPTGEPSPELAERVKLVLQTSSQALSFFYDQRNRYIVASFDSSRGFPSFQRADGGHFHNTISESRSNRGPNSSTIILSSSDDGSQASIQLRMQIAIQNPPSATVSFREGASVTLAGVRYEVGTSKPFGKNVPNEYRGAMYGPNPGSNWGFLIGYRTDGDGSSMPGLQVMAMDADGEPIRFVDKNGRPIKGLQAVSPVPDMSRMDPRTGMPMASPNVLPASCYANYATDGVYRVVTNIDPKAIRSLRLIAPQSKTVVFAPVVLEPKQ